MSRNPKSKGEIIMAKEKKQRALAWPPREFQWIEDFGEREKLCEIYPKLTAIASVFSSYYENFSKDQAIQASEVYGYWFILRDICTELSDILKIDHWTGEIKRKAIGEEEI